MKIIDLLNKIANCEIMPKGIIYNDEKLFWCESCRIYEDENGNMLYDLIDNLNDEVEIIEEEKEIEELPLLGNPEVIHRKDSFISRLLTINNLDHNEIKDKINELVRELNKIKKEGK